MNTFQAVEWQETRIIRYRWKVSAFFAVENTRQTGHWSRGRDATLRNIVFRQYCTRRKVK